MIPPHVGKEYEVVPSEASNAGVRYEVASGEEIPNLGEKLLPVVTAEGSWRGIVVPGGRRVQGSSVHAGPPS